MSPRPIHEMEAKWQKTWEEQGIYQATTGSDRPKFYGLVEFPFPSGDGLHVGHTRSYTAIDAMMRKQRMEGKEVMYPIGWDAFGLPTENYAIKHKIRPQEASKKNTTNFKKQMQAIGFGFDWSREIDTTDPAYYRWTQWQFLKFYESYYDVDAKRARPIADLIVPKDVEAQGEQAVRTFVDGKRLAYRAKMTINWCPKDKIGLANEEAQGGVCERCGTPVEKREKAQWMIRITAYADRLIDELGTVDYLEKVKAQQINWIGRSEGALVSFDQVQVFTTRPDTLFGVTYVVLAPEHALVDQWLKEGKFENAGDVETYRREAGKRTEMERTAEGKEKTGVELKGVTVTHPVLGTKLPVWISDYVLANYGTGAVMAVPAHDERDFAFAKTFQLPMKKVVKPPVLDILPNFPVTLSAGAPSELRIESECFEGEGVAINSDFLDELPTWKAKMDMTSWLEEQGKGKKMTTYKLRDWVFSRQRYWGEPIPLVNCERCGWVAVPESQLPVTLPDVPAYEPSDSGESPLAAMRSWVETTCPSCGGKAERETDTMPNWAGSSWYFLRYCDPNNDKEFASQEAMKYWMPVNLYNGGMEHTTLHLLYSRFWYKFLFDLGLIPAECGSEPYAKRRSQGLVLAEGGEKMSKSKGNVVNPNDVVAAYGADVFRLYQLFMGPYDQPVPWDTNGVEGVKRFLDKLWVLWETVAASTDAVETHYHQTLKKLTDGIEAMQFNTCVSQLMILVNAYQDLGGIPAEHREGLVKVLAPFAPHLTEELWASLGKAGSVHVSSWPSFDSAKLQTSTFELVVQVNGKVRDRIEVDREISEEEAMRVALSSEKVQSLLNGVEPKMVKYVKGKLVSVVH